MSTWIASLLCFLRARASAMVLWVRRRFSLREKRWPWWIALMAPRSSGTVSLSSSCGPAKRIFGISECPSPWQFDFCVFCVTARADHAGSRPELIATFSSFGFQWIHNSPEITSPTTSAFKNKLWDECHLKVILWTSIISF